MREGLLDKTNTASIVWADTAYRSKANEEFLEKNGFVSRIHRKKPPGWYRFETRVCCARVAGVHTAISKKSANSRNQKDFSHSTIFETASQSITLAASAALAQLPDKLLQI